MAKHIVQYKLHGGQIPYFIEDGGYFGYNHKLIGITKDDSKCYIPPFSGAGGDLVTYTNQELVTYVKSLGEDQEALEATANAWLASKGFS